MKKKKREIEREMGGGQWGERRESEGEENIYRRRERRQQKNVGRNAETER